MYDGLLYGFDILIVLNKVVVDQCAKRPCIKGSRDFACLQSENPG
jgi:hypothetical protein